MASRSRDALASVVGWLIVIVIAFWAFGMLLGWIHFVLRSIAWLIVIGVLLAAYVAVKGGPPDP